MATIYAKFMPIGKNDSLIKKNVVRFFEAEYFSAK